MLPSTSLLWAKSSPFMSIITHSLCAGICAETFLEAQSSRQITTYLGNQFASNNGSVVKIISYLVSVHDIGKAHPAFQSKDKDRFQCVVDAIPEWHGKCPIETPISDFRHEHESARVLRRIWSDRDYNEDLIKVLSETIALHHQKPAHRLMRLRNKLWVTMQDELEEMLAQRFLQGEELRMPRSVDAACMLISSLIILMDWVVSSELFDDAEHMNEKEIKACASKALSLYNLISNNVFPTVTFFQNMFPKILQPRPLQQACNSLNEQATITIIEAPMGEGKTEAALFMAARACNAHHSRGIYMALPSQATSNQIYTRMNAMLDDLHYGNARLLHSTAFITQQLPDEFATEDEAIAAKWIRPSRMGFLGANAVGTVDQAMATVLSTKFSSIRLAGLSNKILIIDEIHAYDMYMAQIIETLLRWCCGCGIPVILLSATLQMAQKKRYLACFGTNPDIHLTAQYPLLTQVLPDGSIQQTPVDATAHYTFTFQPVHMSDNEETISKMAAEMTKDGGCMAIMVNTVRKAQKIFQSLQTIADDSIAIFLFHSRFPLGRRTEIEKQCVEAFGRDRTYRPKKAILVATQVVEQSIDLDFDGMISELAPMDLLLQRAGRLHRHRSNSRPDAFFDPVLHVILPPADANITVDRRYGASGYVYDPFLLYNTEQQLKSVRIVRIPEDIRSLVEEVYATVTKENREAWLKRSLQGLLEKNKAKACIWPMPQPDTFFLAETTAYFDIPDLDDGMETSAEASTRLGDDSVRVAFCMEDDFDRFQSQAMTPQEQILLYMSSVSIRIKPLFFSGSENAVLLSKGKLAGIWLLRGTTTIDLGTGVITNDPVLGVYWQKAEVK